MSQVRFQQIPPSGLTYPIGTFEINSAGEGQTESRVLIVGHKLAAGTLAANVAQPVADLTSVFDLVGAGSHLYESVRLFRKFAPTVSLSIAHVAEVGTKRTAAFTVPVGVNAGGTAAIMVGGKRVAVQVPPGQTDAVTAAALVAAVNAWYDAPSRAYLAYVAANAAAVVTLTARHSGLAEDHIVRPSPEVGNLLAAVVVTSTAGTGTPDVTALLGGLGDEPYDWILVNNTAVGTVTALQALLSENGGRWSWDRQIYGHAHLCQRNSVANLLTYRTGSLKSEKNVSVLGVNADIEASAFEHMTANFARQATWLTDNESGMAAVNMSDLPLSGEPGYVNVTSAWTYATNNALNNAGISVSGKGSGGIPVTGKLVTLRAERPNGQPDLTFRDVQTIAVVQMGFRLLRSEVSRRTANRAAVDRNPYQIAAQVTEDDVKAAYIAAYEMCVQKGFFENAARFARSLVVQRDAGTPTRFNVGMNEVDVVNPADIFAAMAVIWAQTRR